MARFRIARNDTKEPKQLLHAKIDKSLLDDVSLLCKWSGNDKNYIIAELLRYALSQESEFQDYKQSLSANAPAAVQASTETGKKEAAPERRFGATTIATKEITR